jgi:monoamine oxidase
MASPPQAQPATVLVLGAGMSGLVAAYELIKAGYDVKVLEGRDVPGGRVQTLRDGFSPGHYAEAGAMFLPGDSSLTLAYAQLFGVPLETFAHSDLPILYYLAGQRLIDPPPKGAPPVEWPYPVTDLEQQIGMKGMNKLYCDAGLDLSSTVTSDWPPEKAVLDQISYATRMNGLGASMPCVLLLGAGYLSMYGDGPDSYSALMMMYDEWYTDTHPDGYQVVGGNDRYPAMMAKALGAAVQYGTRVTAISSDNDKVHVTVESGGTQHTVDGDYAICALPYTVLRDLPVSPALNPARKVGLLYTPCTSVVRVCMEFKRPFWLQDDNLSGLAITDLPIQITYPQPNQPGPSAVLNQLMTGENARQMAVLSEADRLKVTLSGLAKYFPQAPAEFVGGISKVWDADPWAKGAYAYFAPGQMTKYLPAFQQPEGRLYFAGDYMSLLPGWIEGALTSGRQAASAVATASGRAPIAPPPVARPMGTTS